MEEKPKEPLIKRGRGRPKAMKYTVVMEAPVEEDKLTLADLRAIWRLLHSTQEEASDESP